LVGLSYGASVAAEFAKAHGDLVADVTFVSPLVIPTDEYDAGGLALRESLETIRFWENSPCTIYGAFNPFLCVGQDFWFDTFYKAIYQTYLDGRIKDIPEGVEPATYKKAVFHLIRAVRDFDLREEIKGLRNVSMFVGSLEEKRLSIDQRRAWKNVPANERGDFVVFKGAHHALPDEAPTALTEELLATARAH
jgi:pimeloyl-ACP methyl ester carboxylesterase